jgi:hypothetical protein
MYLQSFAGRAAQSALVARHSKDGEMSVIVPMVECDPPPSRFWSTTIAMLRFSIASAFGWAKLVC